jgi:tetratricopeptide (TPR) repeat protein
MFQDMDSDSVLDAAIANHEAGRIDLAEAGYRHILNNDPDQPDALNLLGLLLQNRGHYAEAIAFISRAVEIEPDFPEALTNLARAKRAAGDPGAAADLAARAIGLDGALAEAHLQLGRALLDLMRPQEAAAALASAVTVDPSLVDAQLSLGNARMQLRDFQGSVAAFEAALAIKPDLVEALVNAGNSLLKLGQLQQALRYQQHAVDVAPNDPVPHAAVASTLRQLGDIPGSVEACLRAVALAPDYHDGIILLGTNRISQGMFDLAEENFSQALALVPNSGSARAGLAAIGRGRTEPAEIELLAGKFRDAAASDYERISAEFALGSLLDQEGRYDEAFEAFTQANAFVLAARSAEGRRFDLPMMQRYVAWAKETFTPGLFAATDAWGDPSDRPVFIVGMPRSGTTLVEQIVSSHPLVFGAGELKAMPALVSALDRAPSHQSPLRWDREQISALTGTYLRDLTELGSGASRIIDKLPDNVQLLGQIAVLFPNARIILCRRDLRDVCLSCYFQYFGDGNEWSYDLDGCVARAREIETLIQHWRAVLPIPILEVEYERLVDNLESESRRLLSFLNLDWDPACLNFHEADRTVLTASQWQVRQPLYTTSVGRWRHYRPQLHAMLEGLRDLVPDDESNGAVAAISASDHSAAYARAYLEAKVPEKALKAARQAVASDANDADGYVLLGLSLMELGRPEEALPPLQEALRLAPDRLDVRINLASALSRAKHGMAAIDAWKQALALQPDHIDCLTALATVLLELGHAEQAVIWLQQAAELRPENAQIQHQLGLAWLNAQNAEAAEAAARRAALLDPDEPNYLFGLAETLSALGRFDEASIHFRRAADLSPGTARAHFALARIGNGLQNDADMLVLRGIVSDQEQPSNHRSDAAFALARMLQGKGDYEGAFESCAEANRLVFARNQEQGRGFDLQQCRRDVDRLIANFTPASLASAGGLGNPSEVPVFIVGMPRSGTTLVEQIAASHPLVFGQGETKAIMNAVKALDAAALQDGRSIWLAHETQAKTSELLQEMTRAGGNALRVTDKMPDNLIYLGHIAMLFPRARIILCRRDLRDVGVSCFFESFTDGMEWSFDLADIAARTYEMERLAVHWRNVLALPMLEVQYEDLVADLEGQSRRLIDFLGLEWDPACLSFYTNERQVMTASHWQVRQPLYATSVGRWRHYRRHLGPLIEGLRGLVPAD